MDEVSVRCASTFTWAVSYQIMVKQMNLRKSDVEVTTEHLRKLNHSKKKTTKKHRLLVALLGVRNWSRGEETWNLKYVCQWKVFKFPGGIVLKLSHGIRSRSEFQMATSTHEILKDNLSLKCSYYWFFWNIFLLEMDQMKEKWLIIQTKTQQEF